MEMSEERMVLMYFRVENKDGIPIYYYFKDNNTMPIGLKIEPHYENADVSRDEKGRLKRPQRNLVCIEVWGIYKEEQMLATSILEISKIREILNV